MRVAYVVRSWPRLSQTFVLNEVLALERIGVGVGVFALARADEPVTQPQVADVAAPVRYLGTHRRRAGAHARVAAASPPRYLATLGYALAHRELLGGYTQAGATEAFANAVLVADAVRTARRAGNGFTHIHAHFAHDPTLVGLLAHRLSGLPFSFTAHARDLYQIPEPALAGRAREARAVVTCCRANVEHIERVVGAGGPRVELVYHGVDLGLFRPPSERAVRPVPLIVSVGRLVEKKGFDDLLHACALLASTGRAFRCEIYGDGPRRAELELLRDRLGLAETVRLCGERTQVELAPVYQRADVFALTPRVTDDGDRDGVPNVVVEAMACGVPIVSTPVGGIPEVVAHGVNGLLAPERDAAAVAACLAEVLDDADRRRGLGDAAARTAGALDSRAAAVRLAALFEGDGGARR